MLLNLQFLVTIFTRFVVKGFNLLTFLMIARLLSLEDYAVYGFVFNTTLLIAVFFDVGLRNSTAYFIGQEPERLSKIISVVIRYLLFISLVAMLTTALLTYFTHPAIATVYELIPIAMIGLGLLCIRTLQGISLGTGHLGIVNSTDIVQKTFLFVAVSLFFLMQYSNLNLVFWAFAFSTLLATTYIFWKIRKLKMQSPLNNHKNDIAKEMFLRGSVFMFGALFMIGYKKVGFYVVTTLGDPSLAGIYFGINRFAEVITEVGVAISMVLFSNNVRNKERNNTIAGMAKTTRISIFFLVLIGMILAIFSPYILFLGLGAGFADYTGLYICAIVAAVFGIIPTVLFPTLSVLYKPIKTVQLYGTAVVFNLGLASWLYIVSGLIGVMATLAFSNLILTLVILYVIYKNEHVNPKDMVLIKGSDLLIFKKFAKKIKPVFRGN